MSLLLALFLNLPSTYASEEMLHISVAYKTSCFDTTAEQNQMMEGLYGISKRSKQLYIKLQYNFAGSKYSFTEYYLVSKSLYKSYPIDLIDVKQAGSKLVLIFKAKLDREIRKADYEQLALYGTIHLDRDMIPIKKQIHLVPEKSKIRVLNQTESCLKSIPPLLETDAYDAPLSSGYSSDVEFSKKHTYEPSWDQTKIKGLVELGYYRQDLGDERWTYANPTASIRFYSSSNYMDKMNKEYETHHTFRVYQGTVGYIVGNHLEKYTPYEDFGFDKCGYINESIEVGEDISILLSYSPVVLDVQYKGNWNAIEYKMDQLPKINTCKGSK